MPEAVAPVNNGFVMPAAMYLFTRSRMLLATARLNGLAVPAACTESGPSAIASETSGLPCGVGRRHRAARPRCFLSEPWHEASSTHRNARERDGAAETFPRT